MRPRDRIAAYSELLDRGWGEAPAFVSIEGADPLEGDAVTREIAAIAAELAAERERVCGEAQAASLSRMRGTTSSGSG